MSVRLEVWLQVLFLPKQKPSLVERLWLSLAPKATNATTTATTASTATTVPTAPVKPGACMPAGAGRFANFS